MEEDRTQTGNVNNIKYLARRWEMPAKVPYVYTFKS